MILIKWIESYNTHLLKKSNEGKDSTSLIQTCGGRQKKTRYKTYFVKYLLILSCLKRPKYIGFNIENTKNLHAGKKRWSFFLVFPTFFSYFFFHFSVFIWSDLTTFLIYLKYIFKPQNDQINLQNCNLNYLGNMSLISLTDRRIRTQIKYIKLFILTT